MKKLTKKQIQQKWNDCKEQEEKFDSIQSKASMKISKKINDMFAYLLLLDIPDFNSKEFTQMMSGIKTKCKSLNKWLEEIILSCIDEIYYYVAKEHCEITDWCGDGLSIKDRLDNLYVLFESAIQKDVIKAKATGSEVEFDKFIVIYEASVYRILKTEMSHYYNEGIYESIPTDEYVFLTAKDERVCSDCKKFDGRIFPKTDKHHIPPVHPNCRCRIIEV